MLGYAITAGLAGLVTAGYNTMAPRSQLYGRTFTGQGRGSRQLALTFDDGPNDPHTLKLLEVLARHNVRATFFVLGRFTVQRPEILREVARAGHVIGNHTFTHPNLIFATRAQIETQICDCERAIAEALGESSHPVLRSAQHKGGAPVVLGEEFPSLAPLRSPEDGKNTRSLRFAQGRLCDSRGQQQAALAQDDKGKFVQDDRGRKLRLFRPPYGGRRPGVLRAVRRLGYMPVMWTVTGWDWNAKSAEAIERSVTRQVGGGDVILLHDGGHERMGADRSRTVTAADRLIVRYKDEGYEFVTVTEMMG